MLRSFLSVGVVAALAGLPPAEGQTAWQQAQLKKLSGRWTAVREEKSAADEVRKTRVELEFADGELKVGVYDDKGGKRLFDDKLTVIGVEEVKATGLGSTGRLLVGGNGQQKAEVAYDFVGERLVLVGRVGWRPWEGFALSGEYGRSEKSE